MNKVQRFATGPRAAGVVLAGDRIETSGIVAKPESPRDIAGQTACVLRQLEALLQQVGATRKNLARVQIWLADMKDFDAMNRVYDEWVGDADQPARACVGAQLASDNYLIEIQATGVL